MRTLFILAMAAAVASPAHAAEGPFFSLANTDFVVLLGFLLFIAILVYFKVPAKLSEMLDKRAAGIKSDLDEARALREEAQSLLASYERKKKEVQDQADRIVAHAKEEARLSAEQSQRDLDASIKRRLQAAEDQIASAQAAAIRDVRDRAAEVAIAAARQLIAKQMTARKGNALIEDAIAQVGAKLH
ncbi:MAG: F0F1 ATP synthase subunit B [Paracoccaceae bacterium]